MVNIQFSQNTKRQRLNTNPSSQRLYNWAHCISDKSEWPADHLATQLHANPEPSDSQVRTETEQDHHPFLGEVVLMKQLRQQVTELLESNQIYVHLEETKHDIF